VIRAFDVAYFAASTDGVATNQEFAQSLGLDYPVLADPDKTAARLYGVAGTLKPWASRWTFYVGKDGRILYIDKNVTADGHGEEVPARLKQLGFPPRDSR
jgi:peroxiredoxin Q/BCP